MRSGTIAFLGGILCLQWFHFLPAIGWVVLLGLSIPAALCLPMPWRLFGWFLSGFLWCLWSAHLVLDHHLPPGLEGEDLVIEGYIAGLPEQQERRWRFLFDVSSRIVDGERQQWPLRLRLSWYGQRPDRLRAGEHWRLQVRLKRPHGFANPGGFDYERWLFSERIRATGYVREPLQLLDESSPWRYGLDRLRQSLSDRLGVLLPGQDGALLRALAVGDRRAISPQTWEVLRHTGTAHLLAISGMHIGLLAALVFWMVRRWWPLAGQWALLHLPAPRAAALLATLAALGYAALAGFAIPTQRALIMLAVVMLALWRQRPLVPGQTLAWAALLVLLLDPLAVLSAGFWLSFAAVVLIFYALGGRRQGTRAGQWLRIQGGITLGLAPLLLFWFQQVSFIAPLANLLAIPLVSLLVVPLALLSLSVALMLPSQAEMVLAPVAGLLEGLRLALQTMSDWPGAYWQASQVGWLALGGLGVALMLLMLPRGVPGRYLAPLLCLPFVFGAPPRPDPGEAWLTLLDVGQGLSAVVQTRSRVLVFDTGPRYSAQFDTGSAVVVPYLRQAGYRAIDTLIISHGDNDHIGGLAAVREAMPVGHILTSVPHQIEGSGITACRAGQHWYWDGIRFELLAPRPGQSGNNDASCVLRIVAAKQITLLSADIEQRGEAALLDRVADKLPADILVAPHHGSLTSSTPAFVNAVRPDHVVYPVGYRNRYRFPRPEVVARYAQIGARQYRIDEHGAMRFVLGSPGGVRKLFSYRELGRRYWHSKPLAKDP